MQSRLRLEELVKDLFNKAAPQHQNEALAILIEKTSTDDLEMLAMRLLNSPHEFK